MAVTDVPGSVDVVLVGFADHEDLDGPAAARSEMSTLAEGILADAEPAAQTVRLLA